jgi:hypothetical protein
VFDTTTYDVTAHVPLAVRVTGLAIMPDGRRAYVAWHKLRPDAPAARDYLQIAAAPETRVHFAGEHTSVHRRR